MLVAQGALINARRVSVRSKNYAPHIPFGEAWGTGEVKGYKLALQNKNGYMPQHVTV